MALLRTRKKPAALGKSLTLPLDDELRARLNHAQEAAYRQNREFNVAELLLEYLRRIAPTLERELGLVTKAAATPTTAGVTAD